MANYNQSNNRSSLKKTPASYYVKTKRICPFCKRNILDIDHKDPEMLKRFINPFGRINSARRTRACAIHQRRLAQSIKRARYLAFLPYVT